LVNTLKCSPLQQQQQQQQLLLAYFKNIFVVFVVLSSYLFKLLLLLPPPQPPSPSPLPRLKAICSSDLFHMRNRTCGLFYGIPAP
jgi:hypothetical protein